MTWEFMATADALGALPAFQTEHFEVIFVDFLMPDMIKFEIAAAG
jgi:PleD family two-component response regulator